METLKIRDFLPTTSQKIFGHFSQQNLIFKSGALFKLNKDHFSNDVISLVFPQFINLNLLTKLDKNNQKTLLIKSFDFLLAILVTSCKC